MEQQRRLVRLIELLVNEDARWSEAWATGELAMPASESERRRLYRSLVNVRPAKTASEEYLELEDAFLQEDARMRGTVTLEAVRREQGALAATGADANADMLLWQGDITRLGVDAIVNAANSQLLGCFVPCHGCIDNAIHTAAGVRLRLACDQLMRAQAVPEPAGRAKMTPGFNLPAAHVIHTVGPIVQGPRPTKRDCDTLASCYRACLDLASAHGLTSVAFCCISTGEFHFPNRDAARIATNTVRAWQASARAANAPCPTVVFNVFKDLDRAIYEELLEVPHVSV